MRKKKKIILNPRLMKVNPPWSKTQADKLFKQAKKKVSGITRKEFNKCLEAYWEQHGCLPNSMTKVKANVPKGMKILIKIGNVEEILYKTTSKSRKGDQKYIHHTENEILASDALGKSLYLLGKTKVKEDGWLHD